MPGAAFIAARRRRSKKSGKNESVYSRNASSSSPDAVAGAAGIGAPCHAARGGGPTLSFLFIFQVKISVETIPQPIIPASRVLCTTGSLDQRA